MRGGVVVTPDLTGPPRVSLLTSMPVVTHPAPEFGVAGGDETRWEEGMAWTMEACGLDGGYYAACATADHRALLDVTDFEALDVTRFQPVGINRGITCGTGENQTDVDARAIRALEASTPYLIEAELATGAFAAAAGFNPDNMALEDGFDLGTGMTPTAALDALEQFWSMTTAGGRAAFHCTKALLSRWATAGHIRREGNFWLSPSDNIIVPGDGYTVVSTLATASTAYVTPMLEIHLSAISVIGWKDDGMKSIVASTNRKVARATRMFGVVYPTECAWGKVGVTH